MKYFLLLTIILTLSSCGKSSYSGDFVKNQLFAPSIPENTNATAIKRGKMAAQAMPILSPICSYEIPYLSANSSTFGKLREKSDILPVSQEPNEQPTSPHNARIPNIAVLPVFITLEEQEYTPGHIMLTEKPVRAQANSAMYAFFAIDATR